MKNKKTLAYYKADGTYTRFNNYTLDRYGVITNIKLKKVITRVANKKGYNAVNVTDDDGKPRNIRVARAIASTFWGQPKTLHHTAEHKNRNRGDDTLKNVRWKNKSDQVKNRDVPETHNDAWIIVKDGVENTAKGWTEALKNERNHLGRVFTDCGIRHYAQRRHHGFCFKEYPDLPGEEWRLVEGSENQHGKWMISNMSRVKRVGASGVSRVMSADELPKDGEYPMIVIHGKRRPCHIVAFATFNPDEYANKIPDDMVLHKKDEKLDFRPESLYLGDRSQNAIDALDNGIRDGTKTARMKVVSYIVGSTEPEQEHNCQDDAAKYLRKNGHPRACQSAISRATDTDKVRYGRTWKSL